MHCRPRLTTLLVHHVDHACFASMSRGFCTGVVDNNKNAQACKLQLRTRFGFCFYIGASIRICYDEGEHRGTEGEREAGKRRNVRDAVFVSVKRNKHLKWCRPRRKNLTPSVPSHFACSCPELVCILRSGEFCQPSTEQNTPICKDLTHESTWNRPHP